MEKGEFAWSEAGRSFSGNSIANKIMGNKERDGKERHVRKGRRVFGPYIGKPRKTKNRERKVS